MVSWRWKSWRPDSKSKTVVSEWYDEQSVAVRETFKARIKYLRTQPIANWTRPYVAPLKGGKKTDSKSCNGLWEIRFEVGNVQYRPIGHFSGKEEFTILGFAKEIGSQFEPLDICEKAKIRRAEIGQDSSKSKEWIFDEPQSRK